MPTSFVVNIEDLNRILDQIRIAERHAAGESLVDIIGADAALLPLGLRTVDGSYNHLLPGQEQAGAADTLFPRLLPASYTSGHADPFFGITNTNYDPSIPGSHNVVDADPRTISNLIADQTVGNRAALTAALTLAGSANPSGDAAIIMASLDPVTLARDVYGLQISADGSITVENRSPDIGLSPANSGWMTLFGQFFDHGLDLVTKGGPGTGTVFIPLQPDDPLIAGADHIFGTEDDLPAELRFMALTRATRTELPGADGILVDDPLTAANEAADNTFETENTTTPFVDQNQTYTSHASHQVFLREYATVGGRTVATGHLLDGANGGIANWAETKAQAASMLGIQLTDLDVHNVPLLRTDPYGRFIPDPATGYAQIIVGLGVDGIANTADDVVVVGDPTANGGQGVLVPANALRTGHAFLNDIAHHAAPSPGQTADLDVGDVNGDGVTNAADLVADDNDPNTYDDEMLDAHFITGDGRGNENIGLTSVHFVFHAEHNRLVEENKATILASGDLAIINEWLAVDLPVGTVLPDPTDRAAIDAFAATLTWDGERLFQAARFVTEMQYQHLVFEEFARRIQPNVDLFVFTNSADLDPAIVAEFAHAVYRFGHSMLTDTVDRLDTDLGLVNTDTEQIGLIEAFLNPQAFTASSGGAGDDVAAGAIIRGMSRQVGNEIDEFVVEALRNNLLGLPLDLPALNIARGRETGTPSLNDARTQLYAMTGDPQLDPYTSWLDFAQNIRNPLSVVNFIAAYGQHASILAEDTIEGKREAAWSLVTGQARPGADGILGDDPLTIGIDESLDDIAAPGDRLDFLNSTGIWTAENSGLNDIDLWMGGLAEELMEFGGMLGSTFNAIFEYQMEHLQNGDRFYYLSRTQGMNLLNLLEPNTFADIIMRNTDLGDLHATHLNATIMSVPDLILELDPLVPQDNGELGAADPVHDDFFLQITDPKVVRIVAGVSFDSNGVQIATGIDVDGNGVVDGNDNLLSFSGGEHVVLGGTEANDTLLGDKGIDTLWGDGGDDYLNAGMESDQVFGGDGDDIIEDPFGDDFLRGEAGNDVIVNGHGLDLLFGGEGQDFMMAATDTTEMFAGPGNDFLLGGTAPDVLLGNEGDDWIEGGEGFDSLSGENSELFFNSPIVGHDILNGQGNDTDYDGENGDDIMVQSAGIQRNNGMDGFDWAIHQGDPNGADSDLGIRPFDTRQALILRDRFDSVEGLSGWNNDDILTGAARLLAGEGFLDALTQAGVDRIDGLRETLGVVDSGNPDDVVFESDINGGGEIILGGAGSDTIRGNLGNDYLDGDAWLHVRISVNENRDRTGAEIASFEGLTSQIAWTNALPASWQALDNQGVPTGLTRSLAELMRTGEVNPGQLQAVREILNSDGSLVSDTGQTTNLAGDVDIAVFSDVRANYVIETDDLGNIGDGDGDGFITVQHVPPGGGGGGGGGGGNRLDDGIDLIRNFEILQFSDVIEILDANIANVVATGQLALLDSTLTTPAMVGDTFTVDIGSVVDPDGVPALTAFNVVWQVEQTPGANDWIAIEDPLTETPITGLTFTPTTAFGIDGLRIRVAATFTGNNGVPESVVSAPTTVLLAAPAGAPTPNDDVLVGTANADTIDALAGNDIVFGLAGNDILTGNLGDDLLDGGDGIDTASFAAATTSLTVDLSAAGPQDTIAAGIDTLISIENVIGGSAGDSISGDGNANLLEGRNGDDIIAGLGGNDVLLGGNGVDALFGGDDNDTFDGGAGGDLIDGEGGIDRVSYSNQTADLTINLNGIDASLGGSAEGDLLLSIENVTVGSGNDTINGNADANLLDGQGGNDTLNGEEGADELRGGAGNDTLDGGADNDILNGGIGNDTLLGGEGDDLLHGGAGGDILNGGNGVDRVSYFDQTASLTVVLGGTVTGGDASGDTLIGIEGVTGGSGNDALTGNAQDNYLSGGGGNDVLTGNGGVDTLQGGDGNDVFNPGAGADVVDGGAGLQDRVSYSNQSADLIVHLDGTANSGGQAAGDTLTGIEWITAGSGNDIVNGDAADNLFTGLGGNDTLNGFGGSDELRGNAGTDTLHGGEGADVLQGGADNDTFVFDSETAADGDLISDYQPGDTIDLSAIDAILGGANDNFTLVGTLSGNAGELALDDDGFNTFLDGDTNGDGTADFRIQLTGVHAPNAVNFLGVV